MARVKLACRCGWEIEVESSLDGFQLGRVMDRMREELNAHECREDTEVQQRIAGYEAGYAAGRDMEASRWQ